MKLWTAHAFYRLMRRLSDVDFPVDAGDFRLVDRRVAEVVRSMREPDRYLRGMFAWVGFRQTSVPYDRDQRYAGKTKNSWRRMISFAIDGILGFSVAPLRFILGLGFVISVRPGDYVKAGEPMATIMARDMAGVTAGMAALCEAILIADEAEPPLPLVSHRVTAAGVERVES
jgi:hypothetical protein